MGLTHDVSDMLGSDASPSAADESVDTTDTSFFSAKSENTLVEEPSMLDFDDALTRGIDEVLGSLSPPAPEPSTPAANGHSNGLANSHSNGQSASKIPTLTNRNGKSAPKEKQEEEEEEEDVEMEGSEASGKAKKKNNRRKKKKGPTY